MRQCLYALLSARRANFGLSLCTRNFSSCSQWPAKIFNGKSIETVLVPRRTINLVSNSGKRPELRQQRSSYGYLFVLLPIATFCLGTWQVRRLKWKEELIEKLHKGLNGPVIDFPEEFEQIQDMEYQKVRVTGYVDTNAEPIMIYPRTLLEENGQPSGGLISNAQKVGGHIVMPFVVTEKRLVDAYNRRYDLNKSSFRILVNLGWIDHKTVSRIQGLIEKINEREVQHVHKELEFTGVVRLTEKREPFLSDIHIQRDCYNRVHLEEFSTINKSEKILLDAHQNVPFVLWNKLSLNPVGSQTRINIRNQHLSYIVTWYSLTGIFSYLWYFKIFKPRL